MRRRDAIALVAAALAAAGAGAHVTLAAGAGRVYGHIDSPADLDRVFGEIREDANRAGARPELTRLYRRARYLVTLTYSRPWRAKFGSDAPSLQAQARRQFKATVRAINARAEEIGTEADYDDRSGG